MEHVLKTIESNEYIRGVKERNVWFDDLLIRLMENKVRGRQHVIWQHISRVNTRREREHAHYTTFYKALFGLLFSPPPPFSFA